MAGAAGDRKAPSLAGRFAAAIALTIGFYVLALAIAAVLIGGPIYGWVEAGRGNIFLTIFGIVTGVSILVAIVPRRLPFTPPGPRIDAASQPRLMAAVEQVARDTGQDVPAETYATLEVNAAVTEVANGFLRGRRRVLIVGLPLLHLLSDRGFRGVLAHEFGHYAGGDTRLGPWIWRTRETIGRTIARLTDDEDDESLGKRAVRAPFIWYGKAFLRITNGISRRQEFAADALAAREAGRDAYAEALRRTHALAPGFDAYWQDEVVPALSSGFRPPVLAGFSGFLGSEGVQRSAAEYLERELAEARSGPYDSHPTLAERLAAIEDCPAGAPDDSEPASALLDDEPALEQRALAELGADEGFEPLRWEEAGERVWLAHYRELLAHHGAPLGDATLDDLGEIARDPAPVVRALRREEPNASEEEATGFAHRLLFAAFAVASVRAGWKLEAPPGEPVRAVSGERRFSPAELLGDAAEGRLSPDEWRARVAELGLAGTPLTQPDAEPAQA